ERYGSKCEWWEWRHRLVFLGPAQMNHGSKTDVRTQNGKSFHVRHSALLVACFPCRARAFSLLEMVAVIAILAILAAFLVPPLIRQMDYTAGDQESAVLKSFSDALQQSIMRNRRVPGAAGWDWATNIARELGVDVASITNSPRKQPRLFLIDPNL